MGRNNYITGSSIIIAVSVKAVILSSVFATSGLSFAAFASAQEGQINNDAGEVIFELDPIIVYARQRSENLFSVPVSATVTSAETLEKGRINDLEELAQSVAGFEAPSYGDDPRTAQPIIRGVGPLSTLLSPDNSTAPFVLNGVPQPAFSSASQLLDIEQIELLRGPQGTLFGRNSTGGAIIARSMEADGQRERRLNVEAGTDGYGQVTLTTGGEISKNANGRLALRLKKQGAYIDNDHPGSKDIGAYDIGALSGALKFVITDRTEVAVNLNAEKDHRDTGFPLLLQDENAYQETPRLERDQAMLSVNVRHEFDGFEFHSVTGVTDTDTYNWTDNTDGAVFGSAFGFPAAAFTNDGEFNISDQTERQYYQEFRASSYSDANIQWVVGAAFSQNDYREKTSGNSSFFATVNGTRDNEIKSQSQAVFGNVTVPFANEFEVDAGLRYTHEKREIDYSFTGSGFPGTVASFDQQETRYYDLLTGRLALSYAPTEGSLIYGSVARGAKAGGFPRFSNNASYGNAETGYAETETWSYEIGARSEIAQGAGYVSGALFYNDVANEAVFTFDPVTNTFPVESMDTESFGAEIEVAADLGGGFDLRGGAAWVKSEITGVQAGSAFPTAVGNPVPNVPELSTVLAISYARDVSLSWMPHAQLNAEVSWRHVSDRSVDPNNSYDLEAYNLVNARIGFGNDTTEFYVFADNLLDVAAEQQGSQIAPGTNSVLRTRGRTVGLGLTVNF